MLLAFPLLASALAVMPLSEVRPGQQGVCITEWSGGARIQIPVEVVGRLDATSPGDQAVLVRLLDQRFADAGVVAGMSGSPVYVDGKLLGAVAFGWTFAREALAGVTPFESMAAIPRGSSTPAARRFSWEDLTAALAGRLPATALLPPGGAPRWVTPLALPGGTDPLGLPLASWQTLGLLPAPAAPLSEESQQTPAGLPEGGDMVAAVLVWGDAVLAAGGTLTARDGESFYAFGHPLVAAGAVRIPAARARVLAVQRSFAMSFKLFAVGQPFGTFVADQPAGMVALAGEPPRGLPLRVRVQAEGESKSFAFFLAQVPLLEPLLAAYLTATSLSHNRGHNADLTVSVAVRAAFSDGSTLGLRQATAAPDAVARVATFVGALVGLLTNPPFPGPELASLELELARSPHESAELLEALPAKRRVAPGELLPVTVRLQPFRGAEERRTVSLRVPKAAAPGRVDLVVADGAAFADYALRSEKLSPTSFPQLLAQLSRLEPSSTLVLALEAREGGLTLPGAAYPALPPSLSASMSQALGPGSVQRLATSFLQVTRVSFPYPLEGAVRIPLDVQPLEVP